MCRRPVTLPFTPSGAAPSSTRRLDTPMPDLDAAIGRLYQLDDEQLEKLAHDLDGALADCRTGPIDDGVQTAVSLAGAARILLRQRRAATSRARINSIVHNLTTSTETNE